MLVLLKLLLAKSLGITPLTAACIKLLPVSALQPVGLDMVLGVCIEMVYFVLVLYKYFII